MGRGQIWRLPSPLHFLPDTIGVFSVAVAAIAAVLLLSSVGAVLSHSSRGTASTCDPRRHTTSRKVDGLPPLPASFFPAHQHIGDIAKTLAGHGYLENKVSSGDVGFTDYSTNHLHLAVFSRKGPHPVFTDIHVTPSTVRLSRTRSL